MFKTEVNKICTKCEAEKPITDFYKHIKSKDGFRTYCKECSKNYNKDNREYLYQKEKEYWSKNPVKLEEKTKRHRKKSKEKDKLLYQTNLEYREKRLEKHKIWAKNNRSKCNEYKKNRRKEYPEIEKQYYRNRRKNDLNYRLACNLRTRIKNALKNNYKSGSAVKDLDCSIEYLKLYLESRFQIGMNWENQGLYGWHIDHIVPLSSFNLTNREEFLKACHYTNLQPLWAEDNLKKKAKLNFILEIKYE